MRKSIFFALAAFAVLSSCQKNELSDTLSVDVLYAEIEEVTPTKTVLDVNNNIRWSENDQVVAYMKSTYGDKYQVQPTYVGKTYANFNRISTQSGTDFSAGIELNHNLAYYPYSEDIEVEKFGADYNLNVVLPYEQTYAPESFGNGNFPMVAISETNSITFRNICGGIKLKLKGLINVTSIKIEGKNSEKLSGIATVTAYTDQQLKPSITMDSSASTSVVLNCGAEGVKLNGTTATEFIITLPPVIFTKGFTVTITDAAGGVQTIETNKSNSVIRSTLLVMPEITLETAEQATGVVLKIQSTTYKKCVFTITPANADQVWYKVYKDGETATDADIMATGVSVSTNKVTEVEHEEKGTYFVAAVAKKGSTVVRAKNIDFVIAGAEILSVNVKRVEYKDYGTDMLFDIYLNNSDVNVIKLDCYYHEGATSVGGTYTYSPAANPPAGSVAHSYSYESLLATGKRFFTAGTVEVENLGNSQFKLIVKMTREDEKVYDFTWTGTAQEKQY